MGSEHFPSHALGDQSVPGQKSVFWEVCSEVQQAASSSVTLCRCCMAPSNRHRWEHPRTCVKEPISFQRPDACKLEVASMSRHVEPPLVGNIQSGPSTAKPWGHVWMHKMPREYTGILLCRCGHPWSTLIIFQDASVITASEALHLTCPISCVAQQASGRQQ